MVLKRSSNGKTWYLYDATTNKCDCPAGQRNVKCHHADEVKQYREQESKLTKQKMVQIRELHAAGVPKGELARQFSVNIREIDSIVRPKK